MSVRAKNVQLSPHNKDCPAPRLIILMEKLWHEFAVEDVWAKPSSQADPQHMQVSESDFQGLVRVFSGCVG